MKKKLLALMLSITAAVYPAAAVNAAPAVKLVIDGAAQNPETAPVVDNGSTLVPMRYIAETLGAGVSWDAGSKQAAFETAAHKVVFTIDSGSYTVDGASKTLNTPAKIAGGSTMIPLRAFAESIGAKVGYDAASGTVSVDYFTGLTGTLKISGSTTLQPVAQSAADKLISFNSGLSISVAGGGSGAGIKDAAAGTVNIGMSSRELTESELKALSVYAVASDGIAVIVHPDNPVKALTREQAAKIFLGEIKNWADVGGGQAPIIVTTRETGSGTRATLEELILDKKSVIETAAPYTSSALIKQAVAADKNAIGFDSIGFVDSTVRAVTLDGVTADAASVIAGKYAMGRQLFCATKGGAAGLSAVFIDYLRSAGVQKDIVEKEGYIKLS